VGVIVQLKHKKVHILSMHGKVIKMKSQNIMKHPDRKAMALDSQENVIQKKDFVKVIGGPHAGRDGEIKHLYRSFAFLYSRMFVDNDGIFVCKTKYLQLSNDNSASTINLKFINLNKLAAGLVTSSTMYDSSLTPGKIRYFIILLYMSTL